MFPLLLLSILAVFDLSLRAQGKNDQTTDLTTDLTSDLTTTLTTALTTEY